MKRCTRCVLPETFPGIHFDDQGICQYCRRAPTPEQRSAKQSQLRARFEALVEEIRPDAGYHGLMSWSGGKDSTYTLWLMREKYGLRMLAFTFDNGFISPGALDNMRTVADTLGVDHVIIRPSFHILRRLFVASAEPDIYPPKALERASGICTTCMGLAKGIGLRLALEKRVAMMVYGWSPGQIPLASALMRGNRRMLQAMTEAASAPLETAGNGQTAVYFPQPYHFESVPEMPVNVSPLIFLDWDEDEAVRTIQTLGWQRPDDTDPNSTNCLLNSYGNYVHQQQMDYHPYAMELAGLVREGYMSRDEALSRLEEPPSPELVTAVAERLGVASPLPTSAPPRASSNS